MKNVKERIYEQVQQEIYTSSEKGKGIDTKTIADKLNLQRPNVSAVLNELVKEGRLVKTKSRPVLYQLSAELHALEDESYFPQLVGYEGSLRNAIQLAKAAILYPLSHLNVLLTSKTGCGTTYFVSLMFEYTKEKGGLPKGAQYLKIDVRHYSQNVTVLNEEFYGPQGDLSQSCFARAQGGMLFIDNIDLLDAKQLSLLFEFLDSGWIYSEDKSQSLDCSNVFLVLSCSPDSRSQFNRVIPVTIELPELRERSIEERLSLIQLFFQSEAQKVKRNIEVTVESLKALLLTEFPYNVKGLKLEIQNACANAFVRVINDKNQALTVCLNDLKASIKSSLLKLKGADRAINDLFADRESLIYFCENQNGWQSESTSMYAEMQKQYEELTNLGLTEGGVENVINSHIGHLFKEYHYSRDVGKNVNDLEKLSRIVDSKIIDLVTEFLNHCKALLGRDYPSRVFYGLCLHLNSLLTLEFNQDRLDNETIIKVIQDYSREYAASVQFSAQIKKVLNLDLPIQEVALITLFLVEQDDSAENEHPVMLYIMHGDGTARALKEVTTSLTQCDNVYSYDMALNIESHQAMTEIKALIESIDRGQGVFVIYDMGSIKTMLDLISEDSPVKIRSLNIPITLAGIDIARKCSMENDIDYVYHLANVELSHLSRRDEKLNKVIITLCHTGEGGALQLKNYIDQNSKLGMKTIPLSVNSKNDLLKEVMALKKTYEIYSFVGTYDPKLLGIPFIPINRIFENSRDKLDRVLMFEPIQSRMVDYHSVYDYLEDQFKYTSIAKLKTVLPNTIDQLDGLYDFTEEQKIGLFMHLACLIERLLEGKKVNINPQKDKIISIFGEDYQTIMKILKALERSFNVIINNDEIATIISIIKQV